MNRQIRRLAIFLLVCFLALFVQLNRLQIGKETEYKADPRNNREVTRSFNKPRGRILTADGVVVAESIPTPDGKFKYQRRYPTGDLFTGITGYYSFSFGATGVEKTQNAVLAGTTGKQQVGGIGGIFTGNSDTSGDVYLTLHSQLQQLAKDQLADRLGSVVMLDPRDGRVLAMYSNPTFDANAVAQPDSGKVGDILDLLADVPGKPLLNNAYQERFMPGSTFKVLTTTVALNNGIADPDRQFETEKRYVPPQTKDPIENYGGTSCGGTLREVFARSCNTPFARMAVELGPQKWVDGVKAFGVVDEAVPADHLGLPDPARSTVGTDLATLDKALPLLAIRGFGQNEDAITPLQMAMVAACVANNGDMMAPYVVAQTQSHSGAVLTRTDPLVWKRPMAREVAGTLKELMIGVVRNGTARRTMQLAGGVQAAAKTGTAQLNAKGKPQRSHAWIIAFAPAEQPRFAVAVMLRGTNAEISAGTGGTLAGPIAKRMLDAALALPQ